MAGQPYPQIEGGNDPNYLGYTKEIHPAPASHAWGTLFEGLGKLAQEGVKAADSIVAEKASQAARKEVDNIQSPYTDVNSEEARTLGIGSIKKPVNGTGSAADNPGAGGPDAVTPDTDLDQPGEAASIFSEPVKQITGRTQFEIDTTYGNLERLAQGRQAGTVTPDYYYTQLVAAQKRLRSQFPGYEDVIDQKLHQLTGVIPANAQINSIWQTFKTLEAARGTEANKWEAWIDKNKADLGPQGMQEAFAARSNPAAQDAIKIKTSFLAQSRRVVEDAIGMANLDEKGRTADLHTQTARLGTVASGLMGRILLQSESDLSAQTGGQIKTYGDAISRMAALNNGKGPTPEQLVPLQASIASLRANYIRAWNEASGQPGFNSISASEKDAMLKSQLQYLTTIEESLQKGGFEVAGVMARKLKWDKESTAVSMMDDNRWIKNIAGADLINSKMLETILSNIGGMEVGKDAAGKPVTIEQSFFKTLMKEHTIRAVTATGTLKDFATARNPDTGDKVKPEYVLKHIDNVKQILASPDATPAQKANAAAYLSGPGAEEFAKALDQKERLKATAILGDPKTTETIFGQYGSGSAQWTQYKNFAINNLMAGVQANAAALRQELDNPELRVQFDPAEGVFKYNPQGAEDRVQYKNTSGVRGVQQPIVTPPNIRTKTIDELNTALRSVQGILKKDGETNAEIVQSLGLVPNPARNDTGKPAGEVPGAAPGGGSPSTPALPLQPSNGQTGGLQLQPDQGKGALKSVIAYAVGKQKPYETPTEDRLGANRARIGPEWGNPFSPDFDNHLTQITTGSGKNVLVNKVAAEAFQGLIHDLEARGYEIKTISGFDMRANKSNPRMLSQHALGNAIDINAKTNAYGQGTHDMPKDIGAIAKKWGLSWGGEWNSVKDPMHFEYSGPTQRASK